MGSLSARSLVLLLFPSTFLFALTPLPYSYSSPSSPPPPPFHPLSSLPHLSFTGRKVSSFCSSADGVSWERGKPKTEHAVEMCFLSSTGECVGGWMRQHSQKSATLPSHITCRPMWSMTTWLFSLDSEQWNSNRCNMSGRGLWMTRPSDF